MTTSRTVWSLVAPIVLASMMSAGCGNGLTPSRAPAGGSRDASDAAAASGDVASIAPTAPEGVSPELVAAARAEGTLTTIGLPHDWCGYGDALTTFANRYAITVNEHSADANSGDQLEAIKSNRDNPALAPDVIDVGIAFAARAKSDGLLAPFRVSTWDSIPAAVKDPDGAWTGDYYGVLAFETNVTAGAAPPKDWADLLAPGRAGKFALAGDPRVSTQAIETVYAASLANGGSLDDAKAGLDFFAKVKKAGNLLPTIATYRTVDAGSTPLTARWTYSALIHQAVTAGSPEIDVTVPAKGRLASVSAQAISAFAPHPNAAKLWLGFLYSDEGQNIWLGARCFPVRFADLGARSAIPQDVLATLPDIAGAQFPSLAQLNAATALITNKWDSVVGLDVK